MNNTERYLELLKKALINEIYIENEVKIIYLIHCLNANAKVNNKFLIDPSALTGLVETVKDARNEGRTVTLNLKDEAGEDKPAHYLRNLIEFSHTMIGRKRMDNLQYCVETVLSENIPGDLIETGVWRGGATIFMRGMLAAYDVEDRVVWVADSFEGVPAPVHEQDSGVDLSKQQWPVLSVGVNRVRELFERYDLLDEQVQFLEGWFHDTLPAAPINQLAVLRLDGDLYKSTMDALLALYSKVAPGGFVIVDDYYSLDVCKKAIKDFREQHQVSEKIVDIDSSSVYWRKSKS
jgi:O-methyltransferase